ncbi:hypothetical protein F5Y13DRAFT_1804 [Hypoxylon sp. FL1857]|nr:hypothetical protein F5Y13DRAFT_1804 [Hypoxylon sp. FL1857]
MMSVADSGGGYLYLAVSHLATAFRETVRRDIMFGSTVLPVCIHGCAFGFRHKINFLAFFFSPIIIIRGASPLGAYKTGVFFLSFFFSTEAALERSFVNKFFFYGNSTAEDTPPPAFARAHILCLARYIPTYIYISIYISPSSTSIYLQI